VNEVEWFHRERIRTLEACYDWCGLLRHYVAYDGHQPAMASAVAVLDQLALEDALHGRFLTDCASALKQNGSFEFHAAILDVHKRALANQPEGVHVAITILRAFALAKAVDRSVNKPPDEKPFITYAAGELLGVAIKWSIQVVDLAVATALMQIKVTNSAYWTTLDDQLYCAATAFEFCRHLMLENRRLFLSRSSHIAAQLGYCYRQCGDAQKAIEIGIEALNLLREHHLVDGKQHVYEIARSTSFLASCFGDLGDYRLSLKWHALAANTFRKLAKECPDEHLISWANSLACLGLVLWCLDRSAGSLKAASMAVDLLRELRRSKPIESREMRLTALFVYSAGLHRAGYPRRAREAAFEALSEYDSSSAFEKAKLSKIAAETCRILSSIYEAQGFVRFQRVLEVFGGIGKRCLAFVEGYSAIRRLPIVVAYLGRAGDCYEQAAFFQRTDSSRSEERQFALQVYEDVILHAYRLWMLSRSRPLLHIETLSKALVASEGLRQRVILERLESEVLNPIAPEDVRAAWRDATTRLNSVRMFVANFELNWSRSGERKESKESMLETLLLDYQEAEFRQRLALLRVREHDPAFEIKQRAKFAGMDEASCLLACLSGTVLVEYVVAERNGWALIVYGQQIVPVYLPLVTIRSVEGLAEMWRKGYPTVSDQGVDRSVAFDSWAAGIAPQLADLATKLLWPVIAEIRALEKRCGCEVKGLIVCPHLHLNIFPFHAMPIEGNGELVLADLFEVSYAPSLSIIVHCARRPTNCGRRWLIGNPTGDLLFMGAGTEVYRDRHADAVVLHGTSGSVEGFVEAAGNMGSVEIWAHMKAADDPMASGIVLGGEQVLRVEDIYRRVRFRLAPNLVLNGCESGLLRPARWIDSEGDPESPRRTHPTDFDGLPMSFLFAGARSVVSTLWSVYDLSAALLMDRYHREMDEVGATPASALRRASMWLRKGIRNGADLKAVGEDLLARVPVSWAMRFPERMEHCRWYLERMAEEYPHDPPFASPVHWASHFVTGWCWDPVNFPEQASDQVEPDSESSLVG
jgi:hypothetical protein